MSVHGFHQTIAADLSNTFGLAAKVEFVFTVVLDCLCILDCFCCVSLIIVLKITVPKK